MQQNEWKKAAAKLNSTEMKFPQDGAKLWIQLLNKKRMGQDHF